MENGTTRSHLGTRGNESERLLAYEALAIDLAPIRVNIIQPGFVDTPLLDALLGSQRNEILAAAAARLPVKRIGTSDEIADAVLFLMRNGYVTGITLTIDGGGLLV